MLLPTYVSAAPRTAQGRFHATSALTVDPGRQIAQKVALAHTVNEATVPQATMPQGQKPMKLVMPLLTGTSASALASRHAAALTNGVAPSGTSLGNTANAGAPAKQVAQGATSDTAGVFTPAPTKSFAGASDGDNAVLNGFTLQPPDGALALNASFEVESVNDVVLIKSITGVLQPGYPKSMASFFGIPSPGTCSVLPGFAPFVSDPRAHYDTNDQRFVLSILEVEGTFSPNSTCANSTRIWIAVSQTSDPRGAYNVYAFDSEAIVGQASDYDQLGFDRNGIYFSANEFNNSGTAFLDEFYAGCNKAQMEAGQGVNCFFFVNPTVGGVSIDTMQPVQTQAFVASGQRNSEFFVNSFNINFGGGGCSSGCSGIVVWDFSGMPSAAHVTGVVIPTANYSAPPAADNPGGCNACIETLDTRISATPVFAQGLISLGLETAINNGSQIVPGILWMQVHAVIDHSTPSNISSSTGVLQQGYFFYGGDGAAFFPALQPDSSGDLYMAFAFSGNGFDPSAAYVVRRSIDAYGAMSDGGLFLVASTTPTGDSRWGDYGATAVSGPGGRVWVYGEYSAANGDWATQFGQIIYSSSGI